MQLRKGQILFAVIHHSSTLSEYKAEKVLEVHLAKGYATYGYNKLVEPDGKVVQGRDKKYRGAHTYVEKGKTEADRQYWNEHALGYCLVWDGEAKEFPEVMYKALAKELYKDGFTAAQVCLHKEVDATVCPGKYFDKGKLINYLNKEWQGFVEREKDYKGHYFEREIEDAKKLGLLFGRDEYTFEPDKPVTRAELAAALSRLYKKLTT